MDEVRPAGRTQQASVDVRELRLAVVCYGGVSLAIYMHGVTKEIQKLVVASAAFERDQTTNPFGEHDTARVYWDLLARLRFGEDGASRPGSTQPVAPRTRVVVDIVSGTSAGGINGICLAKGLARNRSQDALRDLWLNEGDIKKLLRGPSWLPAGLRFVGLVARSLVRPLKVRPPLRGDQMCRLLYTAFADMDSGPPALPDLDADTLVPSEHTLQLSVPITDFHGYDREIPLDDPRFVRDHTHRHVLTFRHDGGRASRFAPQFNHGLAFAARATSSFPGAFPPISFGSYAAAFDGGRPNGAGTPGGGRPDLPNTIGDLFPHHRLSANADASRAYFVDGGVLDNFPFRSAIDAIATQPASTEVDRRLLFVEPDPADGAGAGKPSDTQPTWHGTIWGGLAGIPRKEPVLEDFAWLAERNRTVGRVRDVIETSFPEVSAEVSRVVKGELGDLPEDTDGVELASWFERIERRAAEHAGFAYGGYLRLRIRDVVDRYAAAVSSLLQFPEGSYHAAFVGNVLRSWARRDGLLDRAATATEAQRTFLARHDLAYSERHIQFLIAAVSWWYRDVGKPGYPSRAQLDDAKERLYGRMWEVKAIERDAAADPALATPLEVLFDADAVRQTVLERQASTDDFVDQHSDALVGLREALRKRVETAMPAIMRRLHRDLLDMTDEWAPQVGGAMLTRYLGFPYWDVLTYPLEALSGVCERDHVEAMRMSPIDASLLAGKDEKELSGVSLAHFGAFFSRPGREKDYLWGRLDAAERLVTLLLDDPERPGLRPPDPVACRPAFEAILADESGEADESGLQNAQDLLRDLKQRVAQLAPAARSPD